MNLIDFTTEILADGTLHEVSRFRCGCIEETYESPAGSVMTGERDRLCHQHGGQS